MTSIARLYKASGFSWEYVCTGAATVVTDRSSNSNFVKVVSLQVRLGIAQTRCKICPQKRSVTFTQEFYKNFEYQRARDFFHTLETDDAVMGLSFADEREAGDFLSHIQRLRGSGGSSAPSVPTISIPAHPGPPPAPVASSGSFLAPPASSSPASPVTPRTAEKKKAGGGWGFKKLLGLESHAEEALVVSEPSNFRHESSIGWNVESGFEVRHCCSLT